MNDHALPTPSRRIIRCGLPIALIALAACSGGDESAATTTDAVTTTTAPSATTTRPSTTTTTTTTTTSTSTTTTSTTLPSVPRQPLTGEPLAEGEEPINRPALAVKIDNQADARRNHSGLAVADIVYEEIVEGSITRFAAVFHSQGSDPVGPIRSGRSQDVDLLTSLDHPLFAWSGGNPGVTRLIAESTFVDLNAVRGGKGYYRGPGSKPHNLYNSTDALWAQIPFGNPGAPPQQFDYVRPGETFTGEPTTGVDVKMRGIDVGWTWDAAAGKFMRSQQGSPHVDKVNGPIGATNVVIVVVEYLQSQIDARSPEAQTLSEAGPLWVLSNGQVKQGRWIRTEQTDPFRFRTDDGEEILLTPGTTWVELAEGRPSGDPANPLTDVTIRPAG